MTNDARERAAARSDDARSRASGRGGRGGSGDARSRASGRGGGDALAAAAVAAAALALVALLAPLRGGIASTLLVSFALLLAPGLAALAALGLAPAFRSVAAALATAAALGGGIAFPAAGIARASGVPLGDGARALAALDLLAVAALAVAWRRGALRGFDGLRAATRGDRATDVAVAIAGAALALAFVVWIEPTMRSGDLWTYLSYIDWMVHEPGRAYVAHTPDPEEWNARLIASPFLAWQAMVTSLVLRDGSSLAVFWSWLPVACIPLAMAAPQALASALRCGAGTRAALLAAHVGLVLATLPYVHEPGSAGLRWPGTVLFFRITQDKVFLAYVLVPVAGALGAEWMRRRELRWLAALALVGVGAVLAHPLGLPFVAIATLPYAAATALAAPAGAVAKTLAAGAREPAARRLLAAFAIALAIAPLALWPLSQRADEGAPTTLADEAGFERRAHLVVDSLSIASREENRFTASPMLLAHPLLGAGAALALALGLALRTRDDARYVFALAAAILAMLYVPGLPPLAGRIVTPYLLWRFTWLLPTALAFAVAGAVIVGLARAQAGGRRLAAPAAGAAFAVALALATSLPQDLARLPATLDAMLPAPFDAATARALVDGIRERVPPGEPVLLDPSVHPLALSLAPGLQTVYWRWGSDPALYDRVTDFFTARMLAPQHVALLRERGVRWIGARRRLPVGDALRARPDAFEPAGASLSVDLFRVLDLDAAAAPGDAVAHWRARLEREPGSREALSSLALALLVEGRYAEARPLLERAVALAPGDAVARERLGTALLVLGDTPGAVEQLARCHELDPGRVAAANNLVWLLATSPDARIRDPERALRVARASFVAGEIDAGMYDTLAAAQAAAGDFASAVRSAALAVELYVSGGASTEALAPVRARLARYRRGEAFVDAPAPDAP
ncbi:MAG: tetratricopeptide repeat protein [Myxococcota bacterium]